MAAAMFMNSNSLPIALMQSLVVAVPELMWGPNDTKNVMLGRALTYLTMYSTLGMVLRYSYGIQLLSRADTGIVPPTSAQQSDEHTPLLADLEASTSTLEQHDHHASSTMVDSDSEHDDILPSHELGPPVLIASPQGSSRPMPRRRRTTFYNSFPNSPNDSRTHLARYDELNTPIAESPELQARPSLWIKVSRAWAAFLDFMTVSLWATFFSLLVACIQPLQHALTHHLRPVNGAINNLGKCAVPLTLIVLGAYFYKEPEPGQENQPKRSMLTTMKSVLSLKSFRSNGAPVKRNEVAKPGETKTVILAVASRMIITPILILPLVVAATWYDFHRVFEE